MNDPRTILKDAGYIAVGLGVITFQQAQVRRRELEAQLEAQRVGAGQTLDRLTSAIDERRKLVEERVGAVGGQFDRTVVKLETSLTKVLDEVRTRIPEQAVEAIDTAVGAAKDAGGQLLDLVRPAKAA